VLLRIALLIAVSAAALSPARADNWPRWRGPNFNNVAPGDGYPLDWSKTQNVRWKHSFAARGSSTPAVWGEQLFVTLSEKEQNLLLCLDRDGKQLWQATIGEPRPGKHKKATGANPSPATDGRFVFVYYKSGDLACLNFAGEILWRKNLQEMYGEDTLWWDLGTSPVLTENHVVVACMHSGPSYLVAFEKASGKLAWKQDRNLDAPLEANQSYSTPVVIEHDGREQLIVLGADHVTAHDAKTGEEIWRVGGLNPTGHKYFRSIASPVVSDGIVVAPYARGKTLTAIRLGGEGDVTGSHVLWTKEGVSADVPSPAAADGRVYVCTDRGEVACLNIETGETIWGDRVEKSRHAFSASPVLADGRIYVTREDGATFVLEAGDEFNLLAKNELDEFTVATPVFVDGHVYIRTFENLYCIGE